MNARAALRINALVIVLSCLLAASGLTACASNQTHDDPTGQTVSNADVYDKRFSLEYTPGDPSGKTSPRVDFTLLDCSQSKTTPPAVPNGDLALDPDMERLFGFTADDKGTLSDGFEYVAVHLNITSHCDKEVIVGYNSNSIVSGNDDIDYSSAGNVSQDPVWQSLGADKEGEPTYFLDIYEPNESKDVTIVYVVSDLLLQTGDGPYFLADGGRQKKAFRLDLNKVA